ncbi:MAG: hypothetical protein CXT73_02320 [Methanobacteriota archaeon]|nr:MAG: hypothetical protein CXT73_02320 [Euryarchaeota archaeon]
MCYNAPTSLAAFSITLITSAYLYYTGTKNNDKSDKLFSLVIFIIGLMQLLEYFIWKNQTCNITNHKLSLLILLLLISHPILGLGYHYYLYHKTNVYLLLLYLILFGSFSSYFLYQLNKKNLCTKPTEKSCRLNWDFMAIINKEYKQMGVIWYILYWIAVVVFLMPISLNTYERYPMRYSFIPLSFIGTVIYIFIEYSGDIKYFIKDPLIILKYMDVWGSLWCFSAVGLGIIGVLHI